MHAKCWSILSSTHERSPVHVFMVLVSAPKDNWLFHQAVPWTSDWGTTSMKGLRAVKRWQRLLARPLKLWMKGEGWRKMKKVHVDLDKMRWDVVRWLVVPPMSSSHRGGVSTSKTTWSSCFAYACVATAPPKGRIWIVKGTAAIHLGNWGLKSNLPLPWTWEHMGTFYSNSLVGICFIGVKSNNPSQTWMFRSIWRIAHRFLM